MNMEAIKLKLVDSEFDRLVHCGTPQAGDVTVATKERATVGGKPGVVISFNVEIEGKIVPVQATTTAQLFVTAGRAVAAKFDL